MKAISARRSVRETEIMQEVEITKTRYSKVLRL